MPQDEARLEATADWLRYARADLVIASAPGAGAVLNEPYCFHAQQCVEKALRAALLILEVSFPPTHAVDALLALLPPGVAGPPTRRISAGSTHMLWRSATPDQDGRR